MKRNITLSLFIAMALTSASAQTLPPQAGIYDEGVIYYLPRTEIDITVTATKHTFAPGEFCNYAERYLRLTDVSNKAEEYWIIDKVTLATRGVPDSGNIYNVKFSDKTTAHMVTLTDQGILAAVNATPEKEDKETETIEEQSLPDPQEYLTEEILMAGSTAKMAELVAQEIYAVRESKSQLTKGQADFMPQDGLSMQLMLDNLERQEKALTLLFTGTEKTETHTYTMTVTPADDVKRQILFRLSDKLGVVSADNLAGSPVFIDMENRKTTPETTEVTSGLFGKKKPAVKQTSLYYRIPGTTSVKIYSNRQTFVEQVVQIAQTGFVKELTSKAFSRTSPASIVFDTATGAVISITQPE